MLVVVAHPGDTADQGTTPVVLASGEERNERIDVSLEDGVGVAEVIGPPPAGYPRSDLLVRGPGWSVVAFQVEESARLIGDATGTGLAPTVIAADPRGLLDRTDPELSQWSWGSQVAAYGLTGEQARPTVLAAGPLDGLIDEYGVLYGMTHPSGATSTWLVTYAPGNPDRGSELTTFPAVPAGTDLLDRVVAVQSKAGIMISAPSGAAAQVVDAQGAVLMTAPLERGTATAPFTDQRSGRTVRILDADGAVLAETPLESE